MAGRLDALLADAARPRRALGALHPDRADRDLAVPRGRSEPYRRASRGFSSRSSRCSASPGSSSGSSTATTTSRSRRSRRSSGTSRSSSGSRSASRTWDGESAKLYVYAAAILVATLVQVFLPMPWLRGRRRARLQLVLDWRDPAVARVFKLMLPVTLGLGLINVNAVIDTLFASRFIDKTLAPTAIQKAFLVYMLPQGMFSVAVATVLFPVALALLDARRHGRLPADRVDGPAPDRVPAHPRRRLQRGARRADHPDPVPARGLAAVADAGRGRPRSPRSAPASSSTARC